MKTTIVNNCHELKTDPWEAVQFPCLVEQQSKGVIALATNSTNGVLLFGNLFGSTPGSSMDGPLTWKESDWVPVSRPVTITFGP